MDRYQRVEKPRPEIPINENEIRITTQGKMRNYITYATTLLQDKGAAEIVLKAMGRAINKTVTIAEIIKRRIAGLHQNTSIGSTDITDLWEPLEEGLLPLETTRHVSMITITLSTKELETSSTGYQPPLPADQVKPLVEFEYDGDSPPRGDGGRGRGRGRGRGTGGSEMTTFEYDGGLDGGLVRGRGRGWGRGRGRGGYRGRGREQDAGGFDESNADEPPRDQGNNFSQETSYSGRGRGRGRGRGQGRSSRTDGPSQEQGRGGAAA